MGKDTGKKTTVGGQALIEGIMMKGVSVGAMAVRKQDGDIYTEVWELPDKKWFNKTLFVRGCVNFVQTLREGYECLDKSADISGLGEDEGETKFDIWLEKTFGEKGAGAIITAIAGLLVVVMIAAMVGVLFFLPSFLFTLIENAVEADVSGWKAAFEGVMKLLLFVAYMAIMSQTKTMKRVFRYHGAEHKTIACYEAGLELNVGNIRNMKRFHPRCGTSFIIITLMVSIIVYSIIPLNPAEWLGIDNAALGALLRMLIKLPFLPIIVGISYELIRLAGRYSNVFTKIVSAPGLWMQRITTKEPDDSMIEVAIAAVSPCLPKDGEDDNW